MAGIRIKWLSDIADAVRGNKQVKESIEDVVDEIADLGRARGGDQLEADLKGVEKQAKETERAVKDIGKGAKAGFDEAKGEAKQSGREAAASFSGGFEDVGDFVQETLANALGGFGPLGAAAGIALAAIVGTVMSNAQITQENLEEARGKAAELANTMYENGGTLPLTDRVSELFDTLAKERNSRNPFEQIANDFLDLGTNIDQTRKAAEAAGRPIEVFLEALSGSDVSDAKNAIEDINRALEKLDVGTFSSTEVLEQRDALEGLRSEYEKVVAQSELANDLYNSTEFMNTKRVDDLAAAWENAGVQIGNYFSEGEDGAKTFDVASFISDWEEQIAQADEVKADLIGLPDSIREEAERRWAEGGVGAADAFIDAYQGADAETQAKLEAISGPQGQAAGRAAAQGFVQEADATKNWQPPSFKIPIGAQDNTSGEVNSIINRINGRQAYVTVNFTPGQNYKLFGGG